MEIASMATPGALGARLDAVGVADSGPVPDEAQVAALPPGPCQPPQESTEDSTQLLPPEPRFPNVNSLRNRMRFKRLRFAAKHKTVGRSSHETWQGVGDVAIEVGNSELVKRGVVLLDSQSKDDLISTRFASKFHLDFDGATREPHAVTVTGHTVYSVGIMNARWYTEKSRSLLSFKFKGPTLWRFIEAEFRIIDSDQFDVIIGSRTINEHKLFERKGLLAPFRELITPSKDNEEQERLARERREQAAKRRDQHEQSSGSGRK